MTAARCPRCKRVVAVTVPEADPLVYICQVCSYIWDQTPPAFRLIDDEPLIGLDLATGPDTGGYICGQCGFASSDVDEMIAHDCPPRPARKPHKFVAPRWTWCVECGESIFADIHYTGPLPRKPPQLGMW